jgi:hypothetical protein
MLRQLLMTTVIASAMVGSAYAADLGHRPALRKTGGKLLITHGTRPKAAIKPLVAHRTLPVVHASHALSAPEPGGSATLPNGKDAPAPISVAPSLQPHKSGRSSLPPQTAQDSQQNSKTETADTPTHAISTPEPGGSATLPNGKDAPAATTSFSRDDVAPSSVKSNQQKTISTVVVPDYVVELFFREGAKIIELLRATGYSDYSRHEIPPEVIALEPALAMFRFVKRPEGDIGLVSGP